MMKAVIEAFFAAVLGWARQLIDSMRAARAERDAGAMEQAAKDATEVAHDNAEQAKRADEIGAIAGRPADRVRNRDRLRDGSA